MNRTKNIVERLGHQVKEVDEYPKIMSLCSEHVLCENCGYYFCNSDWLSQKNEQVIILFYNSNNQDGLSVYWDPTDEKETLPCNEMIIKEIIQND